MAPSASSDRLLSPHEVIFSCSICQSTITDIYQRFGSSQSLSNDRSDRDGVITKLWLTECAHLTCSEHLEGGGAPFHPQGEVPKAPCPLCAVEKGDSHPKKLFRIVSQYPDDHDPLIPKEYFKTPPAKLSGSSAGSSALRFQYLQLMRFGVMIYKKYSDSRCATILADAQIKELSRTVLKIKRERETLRESVRSLEGIEKQYRTFKEREPEIKHYLGKFAAIARENSLLKEQLIELGYEVPRTEWSMKLPEMAKRANNDGADTSNDHVRSRGNAVGNENSHINQPGPQSRRSVQHQSSSSSRKRSHDDYIEDASRGMPFLPTTGEPAADTMLPPPLHNRQTISKRCRGRENAEQSRSYHFPEVPGAHAYADSNWQTIRAENRSGHYQTGAAREQADLYVMSGALPRVTEREELHARPEIGRDDLRTTPQFTSNQLVPPSRRRGDSRFDRPLTRTSYAIHQHPQGRVYSARDYNQGQDTNQHQRMQPIIPTNARATAHPVDSGYLSNAKTFQNPPHSRQDGGHYFNIASPDVYRQNQQFPSHLNGSPFFRPGVPHAKVPRTPSKYSHHTVFQPEQLVSGIHHLRMEPVAPSPQVGQSLNVLSFIDEPYSKINQPLSTHQQPQRLRSSSQYRRHNHSIQTDISQRHSMMRIPGALLPQQQHPFGQVGSAAQPPSHLGTRTYTRGDEIRLLDTIKGAKSGASSRAAYPTRTTTNVYGQPGGLYQKTPASRGLFSSSGRRSIRR